MSLQPPLRLFSLDEANRMIPGLKARLKALRTAWKDVQALQGRVDIEELTGADGKGGLTEPARSRILELNEDLLRRMESFEEQLEEFQSLGCELKDLDQGLVDFYSRRNGQLCYLCWQDGEEEIRFWHSLEGGFTARQPL